MKKPSAVVALLLVVGQITLPTSSRACGFVMSIWYSIKGADAILLVRIESLEVREFVPGALPSVLGAPRKRTAATLRVLETWKGDASAKIDVDLGENYVPTSRKEGDVFVAFLRSGNNEIAAQEREHRLASYDRFVARLEERPDLSPVDDAGLPRSRAELAAIRRDDEVAFDAFEAWMADRWSLFHFLNLDEYREESDLNAIRDVIRLAVRVQADGADDASARLDWHVTAAEHRATRSEGLVELYALLDFPIPPMETDVSEEDEEVADDAGAFPSDTEEYVPDEPEPPQPQLTRDQLRRLAEGFAREPAVGEADVTMLRLLATYPDLEVDRTAASVVEAGLLLRPIPEWALEMVDEALKRYGDNFADRIGRDDQDSRGRPIYTGEGENTLPTIWEVARRQLGIPSVLPAEAPKKPEGHP